ncbi:beta-propeller domain-containing protein, methanol dehydrogenase [Synechococcus sp. PCC 7502]|nr:beta-propeller domain-containing protein, methanol dehydrogenase [Synechococcus sp. PCC 7502]
MTFALLERKFLKRDLLKRDKLILQKLVLAIVSLILVFQIFTTGAIASEVADLPDLTPDDRTWVIDFAKVISSSTESTTSEALEKLATETGNQVRFVTIQRIDFGQPASEFVSELFDKWFITPEQRAKQTLVLLATEDHRVAIKTGAEVDQILPKEIAASIASETMLFPSQKSNYNQAVTDGMNRLVAVLSGLADPGAPVIVAETDLSIKPSEIKTEPVSASLVVGGFLIAATVIPMVTYYWFQNQS